MTPGCIISNAGIYTLWFRDIIKDKSLADEVATIEKDGGASPSESRRRIKKAIETRYTATA